MHDSTSVVPFVFEDHQIRVVMTEGHPWFVLADCCAVLEIANVGNAASRLESDGIRQADVTDSIGRIQKTLVINEPNLYRLIFRSDKADAKKFQDFVFETVLPEIRRTGAYLPTRRMSSLDFMQATLDNLREQEVRVAALESGQDAVERRLDVVETITPLVGPSDLMTLRDLAHACGTGQNRMKRWLREQGVMFRDHNGHDRLRQFPWVESGYARESYERWPNGMGWSWVPRWTPVGVAKVKDLWTDSAGA